MRNTKAIGIVAGALLSVAAMGVSVTALGDSQFQQLGQIQLQPKEGIAQAVAAALSDTVKSISVPSEGYYTCKAGEPSAEVGESSRIILGGTIGGTFLITMTSGKKVIVYAPSDTAFKSALALATESQLAGVALTFKNTASESQDSFFKDKDCSNVTIANEITATKY